jgi:hypothetical protein
LIGRKKRRKSEVCLSEGCCCSRVKFSGAVRCTQSRSFRLVSREPPSVESGTTERTGKASGDSVRQVIESEGKQCLLHKGQQEKISILLGGLKVRKEKEKKGRKGGGKG